MKKIIYIKTNLPSLSTLDKLIIFLEKRFIIGNILRMFTPSLGLGRWKLENFQRNQIKQGLKNCKINDLILVSDLDEIPKLNKLNLDIFKKNNLIGFEQEIYYYYYYYLNGAVSKKTLGTKGCMYKFLKKILI